MEHTHGILMVFAQHYAQFRFWCGQHHINPRHRDVMFVGDFHHTCGLRRDSKMVVLEGASTRRLLDGIFVFDAIKLQQGRGLEVITEDVAVEWLKHINSEAIR